MTTEATMGVVRRGETRESNVRGVSGVAIRRGHNLPDEYGKQAGICKTGRRHLRAHLRGVGSNPATTPNNLTASVPPEVSDARQRGMGAMDGTPAPRQFGPASSGLPGRASAKVGGTAQSAPGLPLSLPGQATGPFASCVSHNTAGRSPSSYGTKPYPSGGDPDLSDLLYRIPGEEARPCIRVRNGRTTKTVGYFPVFAPPTPVPHLTVSHHTEWAGVN